MKKIHKYLCLLGMGFILCGCSKKGTGTYYPDENEMKSNLEAGGYTVEVTQLAQKSEKGTCLYAKKGTDYIVFYWLNNAEDVDYYEKILEGKYKDYDRIVSIENDSKFGSLTFCGTESAIDSSGIEIVEVKI